MDFWRTVLVLIRRWYIAIPAFVCSIGMAALAYSSVPVQYQSSCILVLTTPLTGGTEATGPNYQPPITNPLVNFEQSLSLAASVVIQEMNSSVVAATLGVRPGSPTTYQVTNGTTNPELLESGPLVFIQGTGPSPAAAQGIADRVADEAILVLDQRQSQLKAPAATHISMRRVVPARAGQPLTGSPLRAAAAAGALAALASLVAVYGFESLMDDRNRRRAGRGRGEPTRRDRVTVPSDGAMSRSEGCDSAPSADARGERVEMLAPDPGADVRIRQPRMVLGRRGWEPWRESAAEEPANGRAAEDR